MVVVRVTVMTIKISSRIFIKILTEKSWTSRQTKQLDWLSFTVALHCIYKYNMMILYGTE